MAEVKTEGLKGAYSLSSSTQAAAFYDGWAAGYDAELTSHGYVTPQRCAAALARHAEDVTAPMMDLGCGTGLSGLALRNAGFTRIDGYDISPEMLARAEQRVGLYHHLGVADLSLPLTMGSYANAAAIGCLSPDYMPVTVLDRVLEKLPPGGCFVFSLNDITQADGTFLGRICELTDTCVADLVHRDYGDHIPGTGLKATVYVLKKRQGITSAR